MSGSEYDSKRLKEYKGIRLALLSIGTSPSVRNTLRYLLQHSRWNDRRIDVLCGDEGKKASVKRVEIVIYWER